MRTCTNNGGPMTGRYIQTFIAVPCSMFRRSLRKKGGKGEGKGRGVKMGMIVNYYLESPNQIHLKLFLVISSYRLYNTDPSVR